MPAHAARRYAQARNRRRRFLPIVAAVLFGSFIKKCHYRVFPAAYIHARLPPHRARITPGKLLIAGELRKRWLFQLCAHGCICADMQHVFQHNQRAAGRARSPVTDNDCGGVPRRNSKRVQNSSKNADGSFFQLSSTKICAAGVRGARIRRIKNVDDFVAARAPSFNKFQQISTNFNKRAANDSISIRTWFGIRRPVVQIHSPRPFFSITYPRLLLSSVGAPYTIPWLSPPPRNPSSSRPVRN